MEIVFLEPLNSFLGLISWALVSRVFVPALRVVLCPVLPLVLFPVLPPEVDFSVVPLEEHLLTFFLYPQGAADRIRYQRWHKVLF